MAVKLVDKVLSFMGFEEEAVEEDTKFNREEEPEEQPWRRKRDRFREKEKETGSVVSLPVQRQVRVVVVEPKVFDEVKDIAENLKNRRPVIVNLEQATPELARRVVDFVMGASYALNGSQQKVGSGIFLFVPSNMDISSELKEQGREKGMFSWMRT
ncbi:MAG: cell division protein SepF [Pelotomaculaceae bacterium]|jgi:cell division inhibitor SepF|uniref:Cell division protein SepF n=1 Tax=anaerobic digester metagenome TaxID=1263854 RepID=A0A485M5H1_9ZZZZ|nr:cell division protein SepF [Bacillota bacterium]HHU87179.1 cell division protein SepF [Peptococcaceae bacterium]